MRIDGLSVPHTASTNPQAVNTAIVSLSETLLSRKPAASGPSGVTSREMFVAAPLTRPISRSGVIAVRKPYTTESVLGIVSADGSVAAFYSDASTFVPETQSFFAFDVFVRDAHPAADLGLTLADAPDPATTKANLTYTATIANRGAATANGVTLVADLPGASAFVSQTQSTLFVFDCCAFEIGYSFVHGANPLV